MADSPISRIMLNNQRFTLTTNPKNGATPPQSVTPVLAWTSSPAGKVNLTVSDDTASCVVHGIAGQVGSATVTATAQDGGTPAAVGTCSVTLQSPLAVSINMVASVPELDV